MMSDEVELHMYDLSCGLANSLSWLLVGKQMEGVWHTSIVVFGREFYFGRKGIMDHHPGTTDFGKPPDKIRMLGSTYRSRTCLYDFLEGLKVEFAPGEYSLLSFNCNNFSDKLSWFLVGQGIPKEILDLPDDIMTGGLKRAGQAAAIGSAAYTVKKFLDGPNRKTEEEAYTGPSWLEVGGTIANLASAGAAFASYMNEKKTDNQTNNRALGWRSNHYDSDSD